MAVCDICGSAVMGTIVKARAMSDAVRGGFNPFAAGLTPDMLATMGMGESYPAWRQEAISGRLSTTDWNVCSGCMTHLRPYLGTV